ncbi:MAG: glycosyltransferase [bacterium]|nr:glycosyltransferase [bacterium]
MARRPLKILRIVTRLNIGGPSVHAITLSAGLPTDRFRTTLACGVPAPGEGDMAPAAAARGAVPVIIPALRRDPDPARDLRALARIAILIRSETPDILHTHMAKAGALGRLAARLFPRVRTVHTFHGHVLAGYFSGPRSRLYLRIERLLARRTDRLVVLSERLRREMLERYRIGSPGRYAVIPLGLDLDRFAGCGALRGGLRAELGIPPRSPVIVLAGRLVPVKDIALFLRAARIVADARPDAVFVIAGDGPLRAALEAEASALGLGRRAVFTGWRADLERLYADADVAVLTSLNEGTPVSLIEAAAAGVPAVATDVGGVADVVRDGVSGRLAGSRDPALVARLVEEIVGDPAAARRMGEAGRAFVLGRYGSGRLLADVARLYEELASEDPR